MLDDIETLIDNKIITKDIGLMERHLRVEKFIRRAARDAVAKIADIQLVENKEKLAELIERVKNVDRWQGVVYDYLY